MPHIASPCLTRRPSPRFARFLRTTPNWCLRSSRTPRPRRPRRLRVATPGAGWRPSWHLARYGINMPLALLGQYGFDGPELSFDDY